MFQSRNWWTEADGSTAMIMGPHQAFGNIPRSIEFAVESVTRLMKYCKENSITYTEATDAAVKRWTVRLELQLYWWL